MKIGVSQVMTYGAIAFAAAWANGSVRWNGWPDFLVFVGFVLFTLWLAFGTRRSDDAAHHEGADQGFAFRLGKTLNRIRRGKSV